MLLIEWLWSQKWDDCIYMIWMIGLSMMVCDGLFGWDDYLFMDDTDYLLCYEYDYLLWYVVYLSVWIR
jgi:hypothetical protein